MGKTHFKTKIYPALAWGGGGGYIQYTHTSLVLIKGRWGGGGGGARREPSVLQEMLVSSRSSSSSIIVVVVVVVVECRYYVGWPT